MEMTQYQKDLVRMWDSLRDKHNDAPTCVDVNCEACPLRDCCFGDDGNISFNAEKSIEIVTQWAKDHPVTTNEDKFKEDWGNKPSSIGGIYLCPSYFGFDKCKKPFGVSCGKACEKCKEKFWKSEYKPPKADKEGVSE